MLLYCSICLCTKSNVSSIPCGPCPCAMCSEFHLQGDSYCGNTRSHPVENSLWKRLWSWHQTGNKKKSKTLRVHSTRAYTGRDVLIRSFLTSSLDESEWSPSPFVRTFLFKILVRSSLHTALRIQSNIMVAVEFFCISGTGY